MWGNIILLTQEHLQQPVQSLHVRWTMRITGGRVLAQPGTLRMVGTCWVPRPLSQRGWRAGDVGQGEEDGATPQGAELASDDWEKHGSSLRS